MFTEAPYMSLQANHNFTFIQHQNAWYMPVSFTGRAMNSIPF